MRKAVALTLVSLLLLVGLAVPAAAKTHVFEDMVRPGLEFFEDMVFKGDLIVEGPCWLRNSRITGNVTIGPWGGELFLWGSHIGGNVTVTGPGQCPDKVCRRAKLEILDAVVGGNIHVSGHRSGASIRDSVVKGNVTVNGPTTLWGATLGITKNSKVGGNVSTTNAQGPIWVVESRFLGNVTFKDTLDDWEGVYPSLEFVHNTVWGNCHASGNGELLMPVQVYGNKVKGNATGQCEE